MKKTHINIFLLLLTASVLWSCRTTRLLKEGEYLVNKNQVKLDNKDINVEEVRSYIKQKPNRKMLGFFPFHLYVYNYATKSKVLSKTDSFLIRAIGEPPEILDTILTNKSVSQIKLYLNSKGYFNSKVTKEIKYKKNKKANIRYIAITSTPYRIKNLRYSIPDLTLKSIILNDTSNTFIIRGNCFDIDVLQSERERITALLKNDGYYYFSKEFITYDIDSALGTHQLNITLNIKNPLVKSPDNPDSLVLSLHKRYTINEIDIYPDYSFIEQDTIKYIKYSYLAAQRRKTSAPTIYNFYYKGDLHIKPKTITQSIFFKQGDEYRIKDIDQTYIRLIDLKMFKFVNIKFSEPIGDSTLKGNLLNCNIQLTRSPIQSFSTEVEATNSAGNLGVAGDFVYLNKNIFKGAEILKFKIRGATEIQKVFSQKNNKSNLQQLLPFNTIEFGAEAGIEIPKFLIPVKQERFPKYFKPKTTINTGISYQKLFYYTRYIINVSYGYEWKESAKKKWIISIPELNSVKIFPADTFLSILNEMNDPKIINSYKDHMIEAIKLSFIYNSQELNKNKSFSWFRGNAEISGFPLRFINQKILHSYHYADGSYMLFKIKYAQYERVDLDFRHYFVFNELNTIAARFSIGEGYAWGNSTVLPFEKSFYAGGSNSIRAWKIYSLGPGSDTSQTILNKTGDINLAGNIEYRFPIYGILKGALFVDAGNIWLNKKNWEIPGGEFKFDRFYKEFAIASGFGLRFDFSFFVVRLDAAIKVRDPSKEETQRWVPFSEGIKFPALNLGIGYPF